jgi:hypothetical protein
MPDDIGYLKYKKQVYELKVGKAMYEWYGQQTRLLNTVRQVVVYSFLRYFDLLGLDPWLGVSPPPKLRLENYVDLQDILPGKRSANVVRPKTIEVINKLLKKEMFLLIWEGEKNPTTEKLGKILANYANWSVNDCSELVRVWGGIVEEVGKEVSGKLQTELGKGGGTAAEIAERLDDIRKRAKGQSKDFLAPVKNKDGSSWPLNPRLDMVFKAHQKLNQQQGIGVRDRVAYVEEAREVPRFMRPYVFPGDGAMVDIEKDDRRWVRGCSLLKPASKSLVKQLDSVFGLWEGADISGTTTDFIGCFEAAWTMVFDGVLAANNPPQNLNAALEVMTWCFPYFALLAPAAMVYAYHHTMYEIALALSLAYGGADKPVFDYHIGFYQTLVPQITHSSGEIRGGYPWFRRIMKKGTPEPEWTVEKPGSTGSAFMKSGQAEENRLRKTLDQAIAGVQAEEEKKDRLANPCVVALIDKNGLAYGGYLLSSAEKEKNKQHFKATKIHEQALKLNGASEFAKQLLRQVGGNVEKIGGLYYPQS